MKPKLYELLAEWWPPMSAPAEYEEEAAIYKPGSASSQAMLSGLCR